MTQHIIFVYNADSGLFNTVSDITHKLLSPRTYACNLCALTHGHFSMRKRWGNFIESLPLKTVFLHRDQFRQRYPDADFALPAVLGEQNGELTLLLSATQIQACTTLEALEQRIRKAVNV